MGKQDPHIKLIGTYNSICYYRLGDLYLTRFKGTLDRRRFMKDDAFTRSRQSAERFALGNRLASRVYREVGEKKRVLPLFHRLKSKAIALLKSGGTEQEVTGQLRLYATELCRSKKQLKNQKRRGPGRPPRRREVLVPVRGIRTLKRVVEVKRRRKKSRILNIEQGISKEGRRIMNIEL